jgi:hypothetical protein
MPKVFEAPPGFVLNPDYLVPELRAQRDVLLEALKDMLNAENDYPYGGMSESEISAIRKALAAIKAVEETK